MNVPVAVVLTFFLGVIAGYGQSAAPTAPSSTSTLGFFVSSATSTSGGLSGADACLRLATAVAQVGHSDGTGVGGSTAGSNASWNSAHANQNCANTAPRGGADLLFRRPVILFV